MCHENKRDLLKVSGFCQDEFTIEKRGKMKGKVLVIEDETAISDLICMNLEVAGYEPIPFFRGDDAAAELQKNGAYDIALVDVMLPGMDGFELLPFLQRQNIPVIFLTAKGDIASKVKGLKGGAEDYLVKPFEMLELLVRMEKILERTEKKELCIEIHGVMIYPERHLVMKEGKEIALKRMEYECLMMFVKYKNIALSREQILKGLWGVEFEGETRTVDVHVAQLRKKLDFGDVIKTIPKVGYRLEGE